MFTLLLGLAARALIPVGYMPGNLLIGEFMVMCPAGSAATMALLQSGESQQHAHYSASTDTRSVDELCPIGTALILDAIIDVSAALDSVSRTDGRKQTDIVLQRLPASTRWYPTRAPPHYPVTQLRF